MQPSWQRAAAQFPFLKVVIVHLLFLCGTMYFGHVLTKDSYEYLQQAKNIVQQGSVYCGNLNQPFHPEFVSRRLPGYGAFLALFQQLPMADWVVVIVQYAVSILNLFLVFVLLGYLGVEGQKGSRVVLWSLLLFPSQLIYAGMIMSEIVFQTTLLGAAIFLVQWLKTERLQSCLWYQCALIAALLIKPVAYPIAIVSLVFFSLHIFRKKNAIPAFLAALLPLFVIAYTMRSNNLQTGVTEFSSIRRDVLINYDMPKLLSRRMTAEQATDSITWWQKQTEGLHYAQRALVIDSVCRTWIAQDRMGYTIIRLKGLARFFIDGGRWDLDAWTMGWEQAGKPIDQVEWTISNGIKIVWVGLSMLFNLFLLFTCAAIVVNKRMTLSEKLVVLLPIVLIAVMTGASGTSRFRVPVFPFQLVAMLLWSNGRLLLNEKKPH